MLPHALFVLALLAQSPSPSATAPQPSALIIGRVVDAASGEPVGGAILQIGGSAVPVTPGDGPPRVMSNPRGQFVIRGLRKGSVNLSASKDGYEPSSTGQRAPGGVGRPVSIDQDDQVIPDVTILMWRNASITGTVVDETGEPVVGVTVEALQRRFTAGRARFGGTIHTGTTDDRGIYHIANLPPGTYLVAVEWQTSSLPGGMVNSIFPDSMNQQAMMQATRALMSIRAVTLRPTSDQGMDVDGVTVTTRGSIAAATGPDGAFVVYPTVFYPSASDAAEAAGIELRSGETHGSVDLTLHPARSVSVAGTVVGPDGSAASAAVHLRRTGNEDLLETIDVANAVTDTTGSFTLLGVTPGSYTLSVERVPAQAPVSNQGSLMTVASGGGLMVASSVGTAGPPPPVQTDPLLWARLPLSVGNLDIRGLAVPLQPGGRLTGRVEFDGTADRPDTNAIENIRIFLRPADGSIASNGLPRTVTGHPDENGGFTTTSAAPGKYILTVGGTSAPWRLRSAMYKGVDISDTPVAIETGVLAGVVLTFTDRTSGLSGTVHDGSNPDPDAEVIAFPTDSAESSTGAVSGRVRRTRVTKDGSYDFGNVAPGDYYVVAIKGDIGEGWQDPAVLGTLAALATQVHVSEGDHKARDLTSVAVR